MLQLFDSHCHLDLPELVADWRQHWQSAQQVGVKACLVPAVCAQAWQTLLAMTGQHPDIMVALGIHPWWVASANITDLQRLEQLLQTNDAICAVGEIGLDFAIDESTFRPQIEFFSAQLAVAKRQQKPVILHHRKSQPQLLAELKQQQFHFGGILHAFSGSYAQAKAFIDLGFKLGIGGTISYERAQKTRETIKKLPLSALVIETDAPSMPLSGYQGLLNTPSQLALVFQYLTELRAESAALLAQSLWQNTRDALQLDAKVMAGFRV